MAPKDVPTADEQIIFEPQGGAPDAPPDLRFLHYNDVYHIEAGSREPVGGYPRFQTLVNYYRDDERFAGQPGLLTFFSGDAFNPSIESSITKGMCWSWEGEWGNPSTMFERCEDWYMSFVYVGFLSPVL
jgi:5'-nucleotidase